jgi:hypothetical protein
MEEKAETIEEVRGCREWEEKVFSPARVSRCGASGCTLAEEFGELLWVKPRKRICGRRGGKRARVTVRVELLELSDDVVRGGVERVEEERFGCLADMIGFDEVRCIENLRAKVILGRRR